MSKLTLVSLATMGLRGGRVDRGRGSRKAREVLKRETQLGRGGRIWGADRLSDGAQGIKRRRR